MLDHTTEMGWSMIQRQVEGFTHKDRNGMWNSQNDSMIIIWDSMFITDCGNKWQEVCGNCRILWWKCGWIFGTFTEIAVKLVPHLRLETTQIAMFMIHVHLVICHECIHVINYVHTPSWFHSKMERDVVYTCVGVQAVGVCRRSLNAPTVWYWIMHYILHLSISIAT